MAILGKIDQILAPKGISMTVAPLGAVCAVLFATPSSPGARVQYSVSNTYEFLICSYYINYLDMNKLKNAPRKGKGKKSSCIHILMISKKQICCNY